MPSIVLWLWSGGATPLGVWGQIPSSSVGVRGRSPPENFQDFMLILDPESTCKWHCNKKSNSHSGFKNEQQADFEDKLENIITET